ncbi:cytochrome p450 oxidoreductase [Colletotrichum tofieldiae]|uniref:Cytochrome p450 oxidoreductase n=1 Tax=Colletotrichum tofieldiae TaxID=708197 RepID=A0A166T7K3_9PEZI|nr:cytochrome p450 oxidoreductase [Colletotrichum tofieldiae]
MKDSSLIVGFGTALLVIYVISKLLQARKNAGLPPLPPGPKSLPLIGNLRDMPTSDIFAPHHWIKHKDLYGPISCVNVLGNTLIIINDAQIAFDLFEKQSLTFSSRPELTFLNMVGWNDGTGGLPYNETLRIHRKNFARIIGTKATASQFNKLQEAEVAHFLLHVLDDPENFEKHIQKEVGSVILQMVYGYNTEQFKKDPLLAMMTKVMEDFTRSAAPGAFLVDSFPALRFVPEWFPGAGWKKLAKQMAVELRDAVEKPYAFVESQIAEGKNSLSYLSRLMESSGDTPEDIHNNKWTAASLYSGGSDTTVAAIAAFFLAMTMFPDIQKKAQAEIDRVVGSERLPTLDDLDSLPYVDALVKEVLRWHPIGPMGLPHTSSEETTYEGYRIPKGAMLMPNIWWFTHDPAVYKDPMEFRPERHIEDHGCKPEPDPRKMAFGFGRRICPGKILAENSMFLNIAQSLAVFNIVKKVVDGKVIEPKAEFQPGVISHPAHFEASIKPRSPQHEKLIRSIEQTFPWQESDAKFLERIEN